jgi:hypothetical protein
MFRKYKIQESAPIMRNKITTSGFRMAVFFIVLFTLFFRPLSSQAQGFLLLKKKHQKILADSLNAQGKRNKEALKKAEQKNDTLEKTCLEKRSYEEYKNFKQDLEKQIRLVMKSGVSMGERFDAPFRNALEHYEPSNKDSLENFKEIYSKVYDTYKSFDKFSDMKETDDLLYDLEEKTVSYPGLNADVVRMRLLFDDYCELEELLMKEIKASKGQSLEKNRLYVLTRKEALYIYYPLLQKSLENAKKDRTYEHKAKDYCTQ